MEKNGYERLKFAEENENGMKLTYVGFELNFDKKETKELLADIQAIVDKWSNNISGEQ